MPAHRYAPTASVMHRELVVAGRYFGLTDWQVARGARANLRGASGQVHKPDITVRTANQLHVISMRNWSKAATCEHVSALSAQLSDINAAEPTTTCSACHFSQDPVAASVAKLAEENGVIVMAPPHCRGYAHYLVFRLLGVREPPLPIEPKQISSHDNAPSNA